ncbi:septum formation family protein [Amycolatopsis palatopharyngis]|uniref:septum formation family protein n=1 Tax=Amycolatopsis palatopharyngis TaxID=187982 RepID=UPI001FE9A4D4|nr:septum formation family protein [Amycolatopsis palatopharyngis]
MSDDHARFRLSGGALRTQLLMAAAAVGAIVALALSWVFSWQVEQEDPVLVAREQARQQAFHAPAGSCLTWSEPDAADARTISCAEPHLFEVVGVVDISDKFPQGAPSPDLKLWRQIAQEHCSEPAEKYLGTKLDPFGKLTVGLLRPPEAKWAEGDRQLRCGVQWAGPGGELQPLTGPAKEQDQSMVWEPGTCLALMGKTVGDPVDCAGPHSYEIVATLDLKDRFEDGWPNQDDQQTWLDVECNKAADKYTGDADLDKKGLILGWDVREQESWAVGSTKVNCKVGAALEDGSGLAVVKGSVKKAEKTTTPSKPAEPAESATKKSGESGSGG